MDKSKSKLLSQNFLWNRNLIERLIRDSSIGLDDLVLEIGAGMGITTDQLIGKCRRIIAVEADKQLFEKLQQKYADDRRVAVVFGDIREIDLPDEPYKVFSNPPFSITGEIVKKLLFDANPPGDSYLVMQTEAAGKFVATKRPYSMLSILFFPWFDIRLVHNFSRDDFRPRPGVDSCLIRIEKRVRPLVDLSKRESFSDLVIYSFTRDRAAKNLSPKEWFSKFEALAGNERLKNKIRGSFKRWQAEEKALPKIHRTRL